MKLFFIHGSGCSSLVWGPLINELKRQGIDESELYAESLPGHPDGDLCDSVEAYASFLAKRIEALAEPVVLIGHSLGGGIALQLALDFPKLVSGVILIGSGARLRVLPSLLDELGAKLKSGDNDLPHATLQMNSLVGEPWRQKINASIEQNGVKVLLSDLSTCDAFDVMERVHEVTLPLRLICGDRDIMTPPKYSQYLAEKLTNADCCLISGATHMVMAEQPASVASLISEFVGDQSRLAD